MSVDRHGTANHDNGSFDEPIESFDAVIERLSAAHDIAAASPVFEVIDTGYPLMLGVREAGSDLHSPSWRPGRYPGRRPEPDTLLAGAKGNYPTLRSWQSTPIRSLRECFLLTDLLNVLGRPRVQPLNGIESCG